MMIDSHVQMMAILVIKHEVHNFHIIPFIAHLIDYHIIKLELYND